MLFRSPGEGAELGERVGVDEGRDALARGAAPPRVLPGDGVGPPGVEDGADGRLVVAVTGRSAQRPSQSFTTASLCSPSVGARTIGVRAPSRAIGEAGAR